MFEEGLYSYLTGHAGVSALVGGRIYPLVAPQEAGKPYCVYLKVSAKRIAAMGGYAGIQRHRMQISCYGSTYDSAKAVAAQVTAALEAWESAEVQAAYHQNETDLYESETKLFHIPVDFFIWGS